MIDLKECVRGDFYTLLPESVKRELDGILFSRNAHLSELHLKIGGASSVLIGGERINLSSRLSKEELESLFLRLTENSLFAYRESVLSGYITLRGGVRVGIVGEARYESGKLLGISNISALCFRIPGAVFSNKDELLDAFSLTKRGLLIYSAPGGGKTSALRTLSYVLAFGRKGKKVAVIDERLEFSPEDYLNVRVDLLRGYRKSDGLEIALRTLAPEVIMLDEIGSESEAYAMLSYLNSGVKIVATAHAESYSELLKRRNLFPFFEHGIFDVFFGLKRLGGEFFCEVNYSDA